MAWVPSGATTSTQESRNKERTRGIDDLWDDVEDHLPGLCAIELKYRRGRKGGRPRIWKNKYEVTDSNRDVSTIVWDIQEVAEEIEARYGHCVFLTVCEVKDGNGRIHKTPNCTWELDEGGRTEIETEALGLIRQQGRVIRLQGTALSRQVADVERASNAVVKMAEAVATTEAASVEAIRARNEHARWKATQEAEEHRSNEELGLIRELGRPALAVMAAREARQAETARNGGDKSALWKHAIEIAKKIRTRAPVQDVLGEKGTEIVDQLGDAKTKTQVGECFEELRKLAGLQPTDPDYVNAFDLIAVAPEVVPILDMIVRGG